MLLEVNVTRMIPGSRLDQDCGVCVCPLSVLAVAQVRVVFWRLGGGAGALPVATPLKRVLLLPPITINHSWLLTTSELHPALYFLL